MSTAKHSSRIEASLYAAVGIRTENDETVTEFLQGEGYTGVDILYVGAIGISWVNSAVVVPEN
ncbi:MAG: hypothetical protein EHM85_14865 [Desulfobacteraceae bacterium]|nr:MAG: hypothetical protein EHM85_14865 [Desulfobacteraceae bacterium]